VVHTRGMPLHLIEGDLFELDVPALGHGNNCRGAMGAGIAVEFKRRYPDMYRAYRKRCLAGDFNLGDVFVWLAPDRVIYNLATQPVPEPSATLDAIERSVRAALDDAEQRGIRRVGIPRIGAGLGGLAWPDVESTLASVADDHPVELIVVSLPGR
jgi:O-acetyl-ADP-ribose deacetylase (regulator of RNase III)